MTNAPLLRYTMALGACLGAPVAFAASLNVGVEIPRLDVAQYHRPYMAVWIERADSSVAATLAVWYDVKKRDGEGAKWLKDLRQWWRRAGRELAVPIDGVTGPTRPAGPHQLAFAEDAAPLAKLPAGSYRLVVEAAREAGGREVVSVPFDWPPAKAAAPLGAQGSSEIGAVKLDLKP
ncbi:DUF2271 domain-containing protein [Ramlibacter sp. H39-3-26]|uniref:DUF2271 domain-containing protein n=1 Tax=Curvibacter soli TaxID=3031331 RepID=UPI0023DB5AD4|nr:DUF2271 domain-containing protein [Ramlibacter sp. H39-3-26]MDF1485854.1 DUF2271 domain-containing protein [Ramlibacter sp. H39-3-26]